MTAFLDLWSDPHARHAMLVHIPIFLGAFALIPLLFLGATRFRSTALKLLCVLWFVGASLGALVAIEAGEEAEETVEHGLVPLTLAAEQTLERHEELGERGWIWPLIPAALVALTLVPAGAPREDGTRRRRTLQVGAGVLAMAASVGLGVWVGLVADQGGRLVYVHSAGVPAQTGSQPDAASADSPVNRERAHDEDDD